MSKIPGGKFPIQEGTLHNIVRAAMTESGLSSDESKISRVAAKVAKAIQGEWHRIGTDKAALTEDDVLALAQRSGYLLEQRIVTMLEQRGYFADPNFYHKDPVSNKLREMDVRAHFTGVFPDSVFGDRITSVLVISAKNAQLPVVAFTHASQALPKNTLRLAGFPLDVNGMRLRYFLGLESIVGYTTPPRISTQLVKVCNGAAYSFDTETMHSAAEALVVATRYAARHFERLSIKYRIHSVNRMVSLALVHPVIVVGNTLFECFQSGSKAEVKAVDHVMHRVTEHRDLGESHFFVDVVTEDAFEDYVEAVKGEHAQILQVAQQNRGKMRAAAFVEMLDKAPKVALKTTDGETLIPSFLPAMVECMPQPAGSLKEVRIDREVGRVVFVYTRGEKTVEVYEGGIRFKNNTGGPPDGIM